MESYQGSISQNPVRASNSKKNFKKLFKQFRKRVNTPLTNKNFTIISNDCWGGIVYQDLELPYLTPFVGLRLAAPCYLRLLKDLKTYVNSPLTFTNISRYDFVNKEREQNLYPIGLLKGDVEIHFYHYSSELEVREKWNRRVGRINWENLFIKFAGDKDLCTEEILEEFDKLHFPYKVCFTAKRYPNLKSTVFIKDYDLDAAVLYQRCRKYFDVPDWLNKGNGDISSVQKIMNKFLYWRRCI